MRIAVSSDGKALYVGYVYDYLPAPEPAASAANTGLLKDMRYLPVGDMQGGGQVLQLAASSKALYSAYTQATDLFVTTHAVAVGQMLASADASAEDPFKGDPTQLLGSIKCAPLDGYDKCELAAYPAARFMISSATRANGTEVIALPVMFSNATLYHGDVDRLGTARAKALFPDCKDLGDDGS